MESIKFLEMLRDTMTKKSDYAIAKEIGLTPQAVNNYMSCKRVMDDTTAAKVAQKLGIDPMKVIAAANADREKGEKKEFWENFYERLGGVAASIIFLLVTLLVTPTPSEAAPVLKDHNAICILC